MPTLSQFTEAGAFCLSCSEEQSRLAARKYARVVQKLGFPVSAYHIVYIYVQFMCKLGMGAEVDLRNVSE